MEPPWIVVTRAPVAALYLLSFCLHSSWNGQLTTWTWSSLTSAEPRWSQLHSSTKPHYHLARIHKVSGGGDAKLSEAWGRPLPFQMRNPRLREQSNLLKARPWSVGRWVLNPDFPSCKFKEAQSQLLTKACLAHTFGKKSIQMSKKWGKVVNITTLEKYKSKHEWSTTMFLPPRTDRQTWKGSNTEWGCWKTYRSGGKINV